MLENKPSILFWVHTFPRFSETFIRDQVCRVIDEGCEVFIYGKSFVSNQKEALKGFEKYDLFNRFVSRNAVRAGETNTNKYLNFLKKLSYLVRSGRFDFKKYLGYIIKNKKLAIQSVCIAHFCAKNNISIIHAHFGPNGELASILKELGFQIKIVTTFHGYDVRLGKETPSMYTALKQFGDAILSISPYNKQLLLDIGFDPHRIYDLPNAIHTDFYCPSVKKEKDSDIIKIITVGRLVEEKSLHIAIQALKKVREKAPQYPFAYTIIGDGELRAPIEKWISESGLQDMITLAGAKNSLEVRDALQKAAIFILSSSREAFPTVLMEAQATGLVVITTDVGSASSIAVNGTIVPTNDVEAMTQAIITTFEDRENWTAKGLKNREYIVSNFDSQILTKKLIHIYNE